jgi:Leucine Rich repeat
MPHPPETETLSLPSDFSLGHITIYQDGQSEPAALLDARGTICLPRHAQVFLDLSQDVCDDLARIQSVPERLLSGRVSFLARNLDKADFRILVLLKLQCLVISFCNRIRVEQLRQLAGLNALEHLNLDYTPLDIPDFSWIAQFPDLNTLRLAGSGLTDAFVPDLVALRGLRELSLPRSNLTDRGVESLWGMESLTNLDLSACEIGDKSFEDIGLCSNLQSLKIAKTSISDAGVEIIVTESLRRGQKLAQLSLRGCRITDKSLMSLASLDGLSQLELSGTDVTAAGVAFLKSTLPRCRIFGGPDT